MQAVLGIYLKFGLTRVAIILDILIHFSWTKSLLRGSVPLPRNFTWNIFGILSYFQMRGLVVIMICSTSGKVCEDVESKLTVWLWVLNLFMLIFGLGSFRVSLFMSESPWLFSFGDKLGDSSMNKTSVETLVKTSFEIS